MHRTPSEDALLEAALELTDHAPAARPARAAKPDQDGPMDATSRSLDHMALLADVAAAFAATGEHDEPPRAPVPPALFAWGSLRVLGRLGEGTFGEVFLAWDPALEREVALKLRRARAGTLRWLDEARALARVRHPNVLVVYGADLRDDRAGIWSERIRGETLEERLDACGPFEPREAARIARDVASALDAVHHARVVHGDLTTRNVMLETTQRDADAVVDTTRAPGGGRAAAAAERVVLMDFGTASDEDAMGAALGTPLAASPERLAGAPATPADDLWALGVLLHRLLTGRYPIEAMSVAELRDKLARSERTALGASRKGVPAAIARVVERALAREPAKRFASAAATRDALSRALGEFVPRVSPRVAAVGVTAVAVLAAVSMALVQQIRRQDVRWFPPPPAAGEAFAGAPAWTTPIPTADRTPVWHVALDADFDRDGRRDALVSAAGWAGVASNGGRALLYRGTPAGLDSVPRVIAQGEYASQMLGALVVCPGDVNGDGWPDALVGTQYPGASPARVGELQVLAGGPGGLTSNVPWRVDGGHDWTAFGEGTAPIGDVNRDGCADLAVAEHDWNDRARSQGRVLVFLGSKSGPRAAPDQVLTDGAQGERFGHWVRGVGDVNGDGYGDVLIGAPTWKGRGAVVGCVLLYLGGPRGLSPAPATRIAGMEEGDAVGFAQTFVGLGDVDGDGYADVAIGAPGHSGRAAGVGEVRVYRGGPRGLEPRPSWVHEGWCSESAFGRTVAAGDVDGDGRVDLVIAAPNYGRTKDEQGTGAVCVFRGVGGRALFTRGPDGWVSGAQPGSGFGTTLSVGDTDGDGAADLLASAPLWHEGEAVTGREWLYRGRKAGGRK